MGNNKVLLLLAETQKAMQTSNDTLTLDEDFLHAVSLDDEVYLVSIEKHIPIDQRISSYAKLLNDAVVTNALLNR